MLTRTATKALTLALAITALVIAPSAAAQEDPAGQGAAAGAVHYFLMASSPFDQFTRAPSAVEQEWLRTHIWRMGVFAPYFDERTKWFPNGWVYDDAYAIYEQSEMEHQHPEWILHDQGGNPLYIPSGCNGTSCPEFAGDIGNPAFRKAWIENLREELTHGYRGVFVDDVNMEMQVSNGGGQLVVPVDPRTGQAMTAEAWRGYMAQFMHEVRVTFPSIEITHNVIWYAAEHAGTANSSIRTEVESANYVNLERGANDGGLTGGGGGWSLNALLSFVDEVHALGRGVILNGVSSEPQGLQYNLATYFLISTGNDAVTGGAQSPLNWWSGWSTSLGTPEGGRYSYDGLIRRNFSGGVVLVNEADEPTRTVTLPHPMIDGEGQSVSSVTLPAASGAILRGSVEPAAETQAPETSQGTQTVLEASLTSTPTTSRSTSEPSEAAQQKPSEAAQQKPTTKTREARQQSPARLARHRRRVRARRKARQARVRGKVLHAAKGRVAITLQRRKRGAWASVASYTVTVDATGHFSEVVTLPEGTQFRLRAHYLGAPGLKRSLSRFVVFALAGGHGARTRR